MNIPFTDYHSGANPVVSAPLLIQSENGTRVSAFSSFIKPIYSRPNLKILTFASVHKINFKGSAAVSVTFERDGTQATVFATKQIIIARDPINTPKLLTLSGIGPRALLKKHHIPIVSALSGVGSNLVSPLCSFSINYEVRAKNGLYGRSVENFDSANYQIYKREGKGNLVFEPE